MTTDGRKTVERTVETLGKGGTISGLVGQNSNDRVPDEPESGFDPSRSDTKETPIRGKAVGWRPDSPSLTALSIP